MDWGWITGNHDGAARGMPGGAMCGELELAGIMLRHKARSGETRPELSGHFHPRLQIKAKGRRVSRACAVLGEARQGGGRMILPAFGAFTGGMDAADPAILDAMQPASAIHALVEAHGTLLRFPLWRAGT